MSTEKLKEYLHQIADQVDENTQVEDIYDQLALLTDIDQSEEEERRGDVLDHQEVVRKSKEWLA
ncbi:MAG: hypothetical protein K2U26_03340 [Cyclobacteriaceae bacterium]|nr:hypothetical protein [Cyclobacteriaceae bacterium]